MVGFEKALGAVKLIKDQIQYMSQSLPSLTRDYFRAENLLYSHASVYIICYHFFLSSLNVCNEMLRGCVDMQLPSQIQDLLSRPVTAVQSTFFCLRNSVSIGFRCVQVLNSALVGCALSVFGFRKNMPTKMTLWTRVIYTNWNWGWKSLDTLGSRLERAIQETLLPVCIFCYINFPFQSCSFTSTC